MRIKIKFLNTISLKWQLSLALIGLAMGLAVLYVIIAKETFESDKIAYVFETQQLQLDVISRDFSKELERGIRDASNLLIGYDLRTQKLNPGAQDLFDSQSSLRAVDITNQSTNASILTVSKQESLNPVVRAPASLPQGSTYFASALDRTRFLIVARGNGEDSDILTKAIIEVPQAATPKGNGRGFLMLENNRLIGEATGVQFPQELVTELSQDRVEKTMIRNIAGEDYLVSSVHVPGSDVKLVSFESKASALGALGVLYERSMLFIAFSGFLTVFIALLISRGLTKKLHDLTRTAGRIGKGDFSQKPQVTSANEIGLLQSAFARMIDEIQSLLLATKEKARMEAELKTARLVQERMFPKDKHSTIGSIQISGMYDTSTECGGDWWYYFRNGNNLFVVVADATGHGAPAALNTAASRSLFANLEHTSGLTLTDLAKAWDRSIAAASGQKVYMTACMLQLDVNTGKGSCLNASHEIPFLVSSEGKVDFLQFDPNGMLGEIVQNWEESPLELQEGQSLFLFTDGLWAVKNKEDKTFSELRFIKNLEKISKDHARGEEFLNAINQFVQDHRKGEEYPDDITLVCIDRKAA